MTQPIDWDKTSQPENSGDETRSVGPNAAARPDGMDERPGFPAMPTAVSNAAARPAGQDQTMRLADSEETLRLATSHRTEQPLAAAELPQPRGGAMTLAEKLSHAVSWGLHPFVLPVYVIAVLLTLTVFSFYPTGVKWYLSWVVVLYTIVIPLLSLGLLRSLGRLSSWRLDSRAERLWPLAIGVVCYVLCAFTIGKIPSAIFLRKFMFAAACCEAMCLVVTLYWKISLHLTAMGAVVALFVILNVLGIGNMMTPLIVAILCTGLLASARLYLGCHDGWQILAGFSGGFGVATLAMLFL